MTLALCLSLNRMVEPSPPALHPLSSAGDVGMADVGVKVEQEECGGGGGSRTSPEPTKRSHLHEWSGTQPLETRQLTPPLSRSPSVRFEHFGMYVLDKIFLSHWSDSGDVLTGGFSRKRAAS